MTARLADVCPAFRKAPAKFVAACAVGDLQKAELHFARMQAAAAALRKARLGSGEYQ